MIKVYCDGGARGNPGPAAVGVVAYENDKKIFEISKTIGVATNNVAEYTAVIASLKELIELDIRKEVKFNLDSELVVKQLNGQYRVKDAKLKQLYVSALGLLSELGNVKFEHTKRANNSYADKLVNTALDK
jgi:ribonuclease HI